MVNDLAFAVALVANFLLLDHAEHRAARGGHVAAAVAGGAGFGLVSLFAAAASAVGAGDILAHLEFLRHARGDFLEREFHLHAHVAALELAGLGLSAAGAEAPEAAEASEPAEDLPTPLAKM